MQIFAIVVSLAIAAVGIALFVRAIRSIIGVMKVGQPAAPHRQPRPAHGDDAQGVALPHPDAAVALGRRRPLVHLHRLRAAVLHAGDGVRPALPRGVRAAADRPLLPVGVADRVRHLRDDRGDHRLHRLPREPPARAGPRHRAAGSSAPRCGRPTSSRLVILGVGLCIVTLRGLEYALEERRSTRVPLPAHVLAGRGVLGHVGRLAEERHLLRRRCSRS